MKDPLFRHQDEKKIIEKIANLSDREIQESLLFHSLRREEDLRSIKLNVQFFFWLTVVSIVISLFALSRT